VLIIDGAQGEGGGQILRTSLALSICLCKPFRIINIRANRRRPGLQHQHLAAVKAAAEISSAKVTGAYMDSLQLDFNPGTVTAGGYHFDIGTAGSASLVLQTILPALMLAPASSSVILQGGTHNPLAPPFEFMQYAFLPLINKMGAGVKLVLKRAGFAPEGGGCIQASIVPAAQLQRLDIIERGKILKRHAEVILASLPLHIAERELAVIARLMSVPDKNTHITDDTKAAGAGNVVSIIIESKNITECFSAFGKKGLPAERVAEIAVKTAQRYLDAGVPIGRHLADQLLVLMALAGGGSFVTMQPSLHTLTNIRVIESFMAATFTTEQIGDDVWEISVDH
jgi:RNA 3'-terminal phosphate cyclase (ATP)